jgi:GDP-mannose 6-dehydrogenase
VKRIAVFGVGYVGCVTAACLSRDGHQVIGVDVDRAKVEGLNAGRSPVTEPGLDDLVARQVAAGTLRATTDVERAVRETEIALIAVGTPSTRQGAVSSQAVERVIQSIGMALRNTRQPYIVVVRSTLFPGILEDCLAPQLVEAAARELGPDLQICNNPEFLRESTAIADYDQPPFVVFGTLGGCGEMGLFDLYPAVQSERIVTDTRTAALLKYACNGLHALKVAFANEIGALARSVGADGGEVMDLVCRDTKLNVSPAYFRPGFAFGGSCLPKDLRAITRYAEREALRLTLLSSILPSNHEHLRRALDMIEDSGHRKIGIVGLSFKAGTDDLRESPYVTLAETLVGRGYQVSIYDPGISLHRLRGRNLAYIDQHLPHLGALLVENPSELYDHASLLLLATSVADPLNIPGHFDGAVLDLRNCLVNAGNSSDGSSSARPAKRHATQEAAILDSMSS